MAKKPNEAPKRSLVTRFEQGAELPHGGALHEQLAKPQSRSQPSYPEVPASAGR